MGPANARGPGGRRQSRRRGIAQGATALTDAVRGLLLRRYNNIVRRGLAFRREHRR